MLAVSSRISRRKGVRQLWYLCGFKDGKITSTHLSYFGTYCLFAARQAWLQAIMLKTLVTCFRLVPLSKFRFTNTFLAQKSKHTKCPSESAQSLVSLSTLWRYLLFTWEILNSTHSLCLEHLSSRNPGTS